MEALEDPQGVGDAKTVKRARAVKRSRDEAAMADLRSLLSQYTFRAFVWGVLAECRMFHTNSHLDNAVFFHNGRASMGIWLLDLVLTASPEVYTLMRAEALEREKAEAVSRDTVAKQGKE